MAYALTILSILLWLAAGRMLFKKQLLAPALSFLALLSLSFAKEDGLPLLPINNTIIVSWLCITLVVMLATMLQPAAVQNARRGVGYIFVGSLAGMAFGLLGFTVTDSLTMCYSIMVVATLAGTFFGYLLYGNTPEGRASRMDGTTRGLPYLLAKGFPAAITVMQLGVALVLTIALYQTV